MGYNVVKHHFFPTTLAVSMGNIKSLLNKKKESRILMIGLDSAGKTSILFKLKLGSVVDTIPTIGFNVEVVQYKKVNFTIWDAGGQDKIRQNWKHYCSNTNGLIFVVDSADKERLGEARDELHKILQEDSMKGVFVLIFANKQDMDQAQSVEDLSSALTLSYLKQKNIRVQSCSTKTGAGLTEGMQWLSEQIP
ncbi:ADP-ribosylation factor 1 [Acrasis kona]|uniref:ADP-ribosylation factor 1 n=1 Tax=Acrasis kona TaxID=1008807 RepID=A0AAW2Z9G4_9EUKA